MKITLFELFNASLHFTNNNFPTPMSVKEILDQTHIFKSTFQTDNLFSIASHPGIFQRNLLLFIRNLCRCLQPCLTSSTTILLPTIRECTRIHKNFQPPFNLIVLNNTKNLSNSFHGQTSLKDTILSIKKALMDIYVLSDINLFIFLFP